MHGLRQRGYSLAEALVGLLLTLLVMVVVLGFFDAGNRLFHTQLHLGTLQQSLRHGEGLLLRWARMAGRGGLPGDVALVVVNDVPAERRILDGSSDPEVPLVAEGSDVLQIRGVFSGPVYAVHDSTNPGVPRFQYDPVTGTGFVTVVDPGPGGIRMSTADLEQLVEDDVLEALYLSGSSGQQVAVELDPSHDEIVVDEGTSPPTTTIRLRFLSRGGVRADAYAALFPSGTEALDSGALGDVLALGILEEYRFFVRQEDHPEQTTVSTRELTLEMARVYPGTETAYLEDTDNLRQTVATGVMDLQLALGFDVDEDGLLEEGADPLARGEDEWLFNTGEEIAILTGTPGFLRITLLGRGPQADRGYRAPLLVDLEDRSYEGHAYNTDDVERSYHRMALQTIAELRNL